jgi:hypothetical protein
MTTQVYSLEAVQNDHHTAVGKFLTDFVANTTPYFLSRPVSICSIILLRKIPFDFFFFCDHEGPKIHYHAKAEKDLNTSSFMKVREVWCEQD